MYENSWINVMMSMLHDCTEYGRRVEVKTLTVHVISDVGLEMVKRSSWYTASIPAC